MCLKRILEIYAAADLHTESLFGTIIHTITKKTYLESIFETHP